jgi:hypothetical protein
VDPFGVLWLTRTVPRYKHFSVLDWALLAVIAMSLWFYMR